MYSYACVSDWNIIVVGTVKTKKDGINIPDYLEKLAQIKQNNKKQAKLDIIPYT